MTTTGADVLGPVFVTTGAVPERVPVGVIPVVDGAVGKSLVMTTGADVLAAVLAIPGVSVLTFAPSEVDGSVVKSLVTTTGADVLGPALVDIGAVITLVWAFDVSGRKVVALKFASVLLVECGSTVIAVVTLGAVVSVPM